MRAWGEGARRAWGGGTRVWEVEGNFCPRHKIHDIFRSNFLPEKWASSRCSLLWGDGDARAREGGREEWRARGGWGERRSVFVR